MFHRNLLQSLDSWKTRPDRKPLVLRGARQTGKTACIRMFGAKCRNFVAVNLERESDLKLFEASRDLKEALQAVELAKHQNLSDPDTLLFIDEIQASPKALAWLRFLHEDHPQLPVIAAGSLLEVMIAREGISFPVGRVEFLHLHPVRFDEFLSALGEEPLLQNLREASPDKPPSPAIHDIALGHFLDYMKVGGMPEAVARFSASRSFQPLVSLHEALLQAFSDDVAKYARQAEVKYLRHVIERAPYDAGGKITYEKFGQSHYRSREMKQAFDVLEQAMLVKRLYGSPSLSPPIEPNFRSSAKLIFLDAGLVFHKLGAGHFQSNSDFFRGKMAEQIVGQTFIALDPLVQRPLAYWYRNAPHATAETDFLLTHDRGLFPVEVKSGKTGSLRSLHRFLAESPHDLGVRVSEAPLALETIEMPRKARLLSVPFYLAWRIPELISVSL